MINTSCALLSFNHFKRWRKHIPISRIPISCYHVSAEVGQSLNIGHGFNIGRLGYTNSRDDPMFVFWFPRRICSLLTPKVILTTIASSNSYKMSSMVNDGWVFRLVKCLWYRGKFNAVNKILQKNQTHAFD